MFVAHSSTNTSRPGSRRSLTRSRQRARACSSRSEAPTVFACRSPPEPADRPAHPRDPDAHAVLALPQPPSVLLSVASGCASSWRHHRAGRSPVVAPMRGLMPGLLLGAAEPVSRRRLSHHLSVAGEMPKTPTASFLEMPQSTAASIFSLRSRE